MPETLYSVSYTHLASVALKYNDIIAMKRAERSALVKGMDVVYICLLYTSKDKLDHTKYNNDDYDLWYYKMYFRTLDPIIREENERCV